MGLAEEWLDVRERKTEAVKRFKELQEKLVAELGGKPKEIMFGGSVFKLTPVTASNTSWDHEGVISKLTVPQRKRLTVVRLDVEAFQASLKSKELDYKVFGPLKTVTEGESYVRVSVKA